MFEGSRVFHVGINNNTLLELWGVISGYCCCCFFFFSLENIISFGVLGGEGARQIIEFGVLCLNDYDDEDDKLFRTWKDSWIGAMETGMFYLERLSRSHEQIHSNS